MSLFTTRHSRRALLGAALAAGLLAGGPLTAVNHAHAAAGCRSDPIVVLSNGVVLDLAATLDTTPDDIKEVTYKLHGPKGVWVVRSISTDGAVRYKEKFSFNDDSHVDDHATSSAVPYTVEVKIHTQSGHHTVWATIAGGYATTLNISPEMVGLSAFQFNPSAPKGDGAHDAPPPHDDQNQAALPDTVTAALASWASSAPWATSVSSPATTEDHEVAVSVAL